MKWYWIPGIAILLILVGLSGYYLYFEKSDNEPYEARVFYFSSDYTIRRDNSATMESDKSTRIDVPISFDDRLIFSFRMSELNTRLRDMFSKVIKDKNIQIKSNNQSYRGQSSMVVISNKSIEIQLYRDMANVFTKKDALAYAVHEMCHVILGHYANPLSNDRALELEIQADVCAYQNGINPADLISAINILESRLELDAQAWQSSPSVNPDKLAAILTMYQNEIIARDARIKVLKILL